MTAYSAKTKRTPAAFFTLLSAACLLALQAEGSPIPKLFGTGVSDAGAVLSGNVTDPHYTLSASADTG